MFLRAEVDGNLRDTDSLLGEEDPNAPRVRRRVRLVEFQIVFMTERSN